MMGEKARSSTLRLSWSTNGRREIRAQKNSDSWCGVFSSDKNQSKKRSLHERKSPLFETRFYWNGEYHIGKHASKCTWLKVLYLYVRLRISIRSVLHEILSIPLIAFCRLISVLICRLPSCMEIREAYLLLRAGVRRPCVETELTATKKSATDGNLSVTTLCRHKRAYDRIQLVADSCWQSRMFNFYDQ